MSSETTTNKIVLFFELKSGPGATTIGAKSFFLEGVRGIDATGKSANVSEILQVQTLLIARSICQSSSDMTFRSHGINSDFYKFRLRSFLVLIKSC